MKTTKPIIIAAAMLFFSCPALRAQTPLYLSISNDSPSSAQITWTNQPGTTYRLLFTPALGQFPWTPLEDAYAAGPSVSVGISTADSPAGFYLAEIPTNSGVEIFSLTNSQIVSGTVAVGVGAQIGSQLMGINFYLDDALIGYVDSGGAELDLDTTHFANGVHTLYVCVVDTGNNESASEPITLDFENSVRWVNADPIFQSFVPINVQSDIYPADWTVFVEDTNGATVRTLSGTTTDGLIETNWDGNDENGIYAPDQTSYTVTVVVSESGAQGATMMASSSSTSGSSITSFSSHANHYGAPEYMVYEPAPDYATLYDAMVQNYWAMPKEDRIMFPPFWLSPTNDWPTVIERTLSARELFLEQHGAAGTYSSAAQTASTGGISQDSSGGTLHSIKNILWREAGWGSGQIILARQTLSVFNPLNSALLGLYNNVQNFIAEADISGKDVYQGGILLLANDGDFSQLRSALTSTSPNTRELFYWGHGSRDGNSIGYAGSTPNDGIIASDLDSLLANFVSPARNGQPIKIGTHKPFDFVFLDGCMTGRGNLPEAFGIPKVVPSASYARLGVHKRAFMGWGGRVTASILDNDHFNWSVKFWEEWLRDPHTSTVQNAVDAANAAYPSAASTGMIIVGSTDLTWSN